MHTKEETRKAVRNLILIIIGCAIAMWLLPGCKTVHDVQIVERVKTDTVWKSKMQRDSVWLHDSIIERIAGDTVMIERWHTRWRDRLLMDTVYVSKTDTVKVEKTIEKAYKLAWWKKGLMDIGAAFLLAVSCALCLYLFRKKLPF